MAFSERILKRKFKKNILLISFILVAILPVIAFNLIRIINNPVPRFVETPESSKYILEVSNENYKAKIGGKDGNTASVQFINPDKKDITFSYISQDKKKPTVESDSRKVTFKNVDKNIDIEYIPLANGLKENIILTDKPKSNYYYFATDIKKAIVKKHYKGEGVPAFYTDKGEYLFNIEPGYAIDARGKRTDDIKIDVIKSEGKHYLRVKVDEKWLTSKNRAYPIKVDPTIVYDTSSEFANGVFNRARDTGSGANPVIETTYQELNTDAHTAGLWHMNESSGNIQDASGNGNIGTPTGTTVVTGIVSNARDFNGSSDFINLGNASVLNITGDLSIEAWVKVDSYASGLAVVTWANGSYTLFPYHVAINTTGTLRFNSSTTGLFDSTGIVPLGVWSHIAITTEGKLLSFYINGELDTTHQLPSATRSAGDGYLSLSRASTQYFDGSIDEVRISDKARTKEEILQSYNKSAYSVYTSEVIDIGSPITTWNNLTWTELGVLTGSAETLSNTTSLVAQWNLNETSGTTATNNTGSCGVSCNGTLTSFDSTASQDADPDSSWTSNQRRWGTGALMFDGVDSYVTIPDNNALSFGNAGTDTAFSISTWVYPRSITTTAGVGNWIINKRDAAAGDEYQLIFYEGKLLGGLFTGNANNIRKVSNRIFTPDRWYNIVMTYDGSKSVNGINLYVNGALEPSTASSAGTYTGMNNGTAAVTIGKAGWSNSLYFDGIIDSTFIVGRQMTANEILSNYQSSNLEIQTRVGSDNTPNDGSWETWRPNTVETSLTAMDNQFLYPTNDSGQTLYWPLDETANNTCTGGVNDVCDKTGSNDAEISGTTIRSGAYGKARGFPGNTITDFIYKPSYAAIPTTSISVEFWIKTKGSLDGIFSYASTAGDNDFLIYDSSNLQIFRNATPLISGVSVNDNQWHHVVATWRSSDGQTQIYKDGKLAYTGTTQTGTSITTGGVLMIGQEQDSIGGGLSAAQAFKGTIDEIKVFNTVLSASNVYTNYLLGSRDIAYTNREPDSVIKTEGSYSQEIKNTSIQNDSNTISAWSFEETSGTGAFIKDITGNNSITPTGSSLTRGVIGNARLFSTSDNFATTLNGFDTTQNNITVSFWARPTMTGPINTTFLAATPNDTANRFLIHFPWSDGNMYWDYGDISTVGRLSVAFNTSWYGEWAHWAFVSEQGVGQKIYRNGSLIASDATAGTFSKEAKTLAFPSSWQGVLDEVEISGVARTQKEINDAYRQGSDTYINLPINSTNLTTERNLKLDIAADTSGQYLKALIGESAFANYQTDSDTVGLWHFDETITNPEYFEDTSGNNNKINYTPFTATGGTITSSGIYTIHTFTSDGTFAANKPGVVEALVVGGGGGGGAKSASTNAGGGGGGGQVLYNSAFVVGSGNTTVTIGNGGAGGVEGTQAGTYGTNGASSIFGSLTAIGGGGGGGVSYAAADLGLAGRNGANGGGGGGGQGPAGGTGTAGYNGGTGSNTISSSGWWRGGGGGGAGGVGATGDASGNGGNGVAYSISGSSTYYGGGGGGGRHNNGTLGYNAGTGGLGGGGNGGYTSNGSNGTPNTGGGGGGGGGGSNGTSQGGTGGSGIVIVRYENGQSTTVGEGRIGKGRYFNGLSEYLQTTNNYNFTSESFTISMWVKPSDISNNPVVVSNGSWQVDGYYMHILSNGGVQFITSQAGAIQVSSSKAGSVKVNQWNHIAVVRSGSSVRTYVNGMDQTTVVGTHVNPTSTTTPFRIGNYSSGTLYMYKGYLDELRVDRVARTAEEIRQAFNFDSRTYDIEIDFSARLDNSNLISSIGDTSFIVDATYHGAHQKGDNLYVGDRIIVRENVNGIRYMATGTVTSVTASTGSAGVSGWDAGSTFPPSGYTQNASLFKWQTEYWKIQETNLSSHLDAVSLITIRVTDGKIGRELWIDNIGSTGSYLTNPSGSTITSSTGNRYMQYRVIQNSNSRDLSSKLSLLSVDYTSNVAPNTPTLDSPSDVTASQPLRPVLRTTATDVDLDYMRYRIQLCEDIFMTRNCQTFDQTSSQTGWSGQNTQTNTAYTNGSQATYTLQSDLEEGKTYYWRSYAIDPGGMNQWSTTQSEPFAFAVNARPRPNQNVYKQHFIARRESSYPSSTTGWASINGAAESGTTGSPNGWIAGSNFTVGDRYLIMVWGSHQADNISAKSGLRVKYGSTPFTESQAIETSNQSATSYKTPYFWFTVWTAQNANLEVETYWSGNAGTESRVEDVTLVAINAEELITNGDLYYNISTSGGSLSTTYTAKASAAFTTTNTSPWWIMGYSQADIIDIDSDKYQTRINLINTVTFPVYNQTETTFGATSISGKDAVDTPVYGTGYVQEIATGVDVDANLEIKESASDQQWAAAGVLALNLKAFDSYSYATTTNNTTLNTPSAWVEQGQINPLNRYTSNYIIASGSVIDDAGTKTISRIQNSEVNITDDIGGWRHNTGDITPLTVADINTNLTGGIKNLEMDSQSTLAGTSTVDDRWMVAFSLEEPSIGPTLNAPTIGATNQSIRTQFKIVAHDPDNDSLMYKIDLCSNLAMTTNCQTFNQQSSQTGWTGQNAFSNQRYASGTEGTYTLQSDLLPNTTYYWRAYVIDPSGTNTFTEASAIRSFTTTQSPFQPSAIEIEASTNPINVTDLTPEISAVHTDPESDSANYIRIQVSTVSNFATTVWDTGKLIMTTTTSGSRTPALSYSGSTLSLNGQKYYVRIKLWDVKSAESAWSATSTFQMYLLEPANGCYITDTDPTDTTIIIKWNDNSSLEDGFRLQKSVNGGAFTTLITKPANSTFHTDSISAGNTYRYRISTSYAGYFAPDCTTSTADVKTGEIRIGGIKIEGIKID